MPATAKHATAVLVTRPPGQAQELCAAVADAGFTVHSLPMLQLLPLAEPAPSLRQLVQDLDRVRVAGAAIHINPGLAPTVASDIDHLDRHAEGAPGAQWPRGWQDRTMPETYATIATNKGDIVVTLFPDQAPKTVRNYVSNIFDKLQVNDRAQAIVRARDAGLGDAQ